MENLWTFPETVGRLDVTGFEVEAIDGSVGKVDESSNAVGESYLVVNTGVWKFGKTVILPAGLIERVGNRGRIAMADDGRMQRIGGGNAGRPGCADRRENLHQHRNQDDWKEFSQPPAHDPTSSDFVLNHAGSRESSSGSQGCDDRRADALFLTQLSVAQPEVAKCDSFRRLLEF